MPVGKLRAVRSNFESEIEGAEDLAAKAAGWTAPGPEYEALVELAFLKAYIGWEVFVEQAFYVYAQGYPAPDGSRAVRYVRPNDDDHVTQLIQPHPLRYVDWTVPETIRSRAKSFFKDGEPFETVLASSTHFLHNLKKIRNAIAHASIDAVSKYESYATTTLGRPCTGLRPGAFLIEPAPGNSQSTILADFFEQLRALAHAVVP